MQFTHPCAVVATWQMQLNDPSTSDIICNTQWHWFHAKELQLWWYNIVSVYFCSQFAMHLLNSYFRDYTDKCDIIIPVCLIKTILWGFDDVIKWYLPIIKMQNQAYFFEQLSCIWCPTTMITIKFEIDMSIHSDLP